MSKSAVVFGYSGHAYVVLDILLANQYHIAGYCDTTAKNNNPFNLHYWGTEQDGHLFEKLKGHHAFLGIGNNPIRAKLFEKLVQHHINTPSAIHTSAVLSPFAKIGAGTVVMPGAVINAMAKIGNAVICNSSCVIEHECIIDDYAHIAPGAVLAGNVSIGKNSFVGANAVVKQGITIGANAVIGAGAVIIKDVADGLTVYGNPAKSK